MDRVIVNQCAHGIPGKYRLIRLLTNRNKSSHICLKDRLALQLEVESSLQTSSSVLTTLSSKTKGAGNLVLQTLFRVACSNMLTW